MDIRKVHVGHPLGFYEVTDRWGRRVRRLDPPGHGRIDADLWFNVRRFQEHVPSAEVTAFAHKGQLQPMLIELQDVFRLNPGRTVVWQLILDKGGDDFVRVCTVFMEPKLVDYSWWRRVAALGLEIAAWCFNKTIAKWFPIRYDT